MEDKRRTKNVLDRGFRQLSHVASVKIGNITCMRYRARVCKNGEKEGNEDTEAFRNDPQISLVRP